MKTTDAINQVSLQEAFASTLLHSLWQGVILVFALWITRKIFHDYKKLQHLACLFALVALVMSCVFTFMYVKTQNSTGLYYSGQIAEYLSQPKLFMILNIIWLVGAFIFFLRFLTAHFYLRKLIHNSEQLFNPKWMGIFKNLLNYYGLNKSVILLHSNKVSSAFLTGVIKPVIIIPTAWINQLNIKEAECILAHELSHVLNKDHWINLFIHFSEIILYFNPAVHILISHIKLERELNADNSACTYLKDPILYAKLILKIEESATVMPLMVLPFFQQRKQLKRRIESVLKIKSSYSEPGSKVALTGLFLSLILFGFLSFKTNIIPLNNFNNNNKQELICESQAPKFLENCITPITTPKAANKPAHKTFKVRLKTEQKERSLTQIKKTIHKERGIKEVMVYQEEDIAMDYNGHDPLKQLQKEINLEQKSHTTVIYEITKTRDDDSTLMEYGGNWIIPQQPKCYAPAEIKTYIIIQSRNHPLFESDPDWSNHSSRLRLPSGTKQ